MQQYVIVPRKNPIKPDESPRYYALARSMRKVDVDEICSRISERSSYSLGELEGPSESFSWKSRMSLPKAASPR